MQIENFKAKEFSVFEIFVDKNVPFFVPFYQRKYNWTYEEEVLELINDLEEFYLEIKNGNQKSYYLGNIIVKPIKSKLSNTIKQYILIDGQQRLTTLILIFNYLKKILKKLKNSFTSEEYELYIFELDKILYSNMINKRILSLSNPSSDDVLMRIFDSNDFDNLNSEIKKTIYFQNYENISKKLNIQSKEELEKWFKILKNIKLAQISLGENDNEISVFESINSKGLPLNSLDLIKNYLFLISSSNEWRNDDIDKRIENIMSNKLEKIFIQKNGKKDEGAMNHFFSSLIEKEKFIEPIKNKKEIYKEFKKIEYIKNKNISKEQFEIFLFKLENTIDDYQNLLKYKKEFHISRNIKNYSFSYLLNSKFDLYLTLFFIISEKLRNKEINQEEANKIYELLDMHNMSMSIKGSVNKDSRFISKYIKLVNGNINYVNLLDYLTNNFKNKSRLTTIEEFTNGFKNTDLYLSDKKMSKYILYRIENYLNYRSGEKIPFNYTLEHIFPINDRNWKNNFDSLEYKESFIHTIGNLTLLTNNVNSSLSNDGWETKKEKMKEYSYLIKLNKELIESNSEWNIKENNNSVLKRSEILLKYIKKIWPIELMKNVKKPFHIKDKLIIQKQKLTIADAIEIVLFENYGLALTPKQIEKEIKNLIVYIENNDFNIEITFSKDKISSGGWMIERLHSNCYECNSKRNEKNLFKKNDKKWTLIEENYLKIKNKLKNHF
ncbi:MAG: hypothetical protein TYPL_1840 [Candidatus Tyloplasma litorale]|nr:MAG: hypothetical protein TYPL_1840 [Mycoplasmatales bacterium]